MVECLRLSVVERWHESPLASMEDDVFRRRFPRKTRNEFRPDSGVLTEFRKVKKTSQTRASSKSYAPSVDQFWPKLAVFAGRSYSLRVQRTRDSFISFGNSEKRFFFFDIAPTTFSPQRYITEEPKSSPRISKAPSLPTYRSARGNCFLENTVGELLFSPIEVHAFSTRLSGMRLKKRASMKRRRFRSGRGWTILLRGKYDVNTLTYPLTNRIHLKRTVKII